MKFRYTVIITLILLIILGSWGYSNKRIIINYLRTIAYSQEGMIKKSRSFTEEINTDAEISIIKTSRVPIQQKELKIPNFANGVGAITKIGNLILIQDSIGVFMCFQKNKFINISGKIDNGISKYLRFQKAGYDTDSLRYHSLEFDEKLNLLIISLTRYVGAKQNKLTIVTVPIKNQSDCQSLKINFEDTEIIYESDPVPSTAKSHAGGGRMILDKKQNIYFSVGYSGIDYVNPDFPTSPQRKDNSFGKIFSYNLVNKTLQLLSIGHRNVQGLSLNLNGDLYSSEHGPQGGDEVNKISLNGNYGFPYHTYGTNYNSYKWKFDQYLKDNPLNYNDPTFAFVPSIAPSAMTFINGFFEYWESDLLLTSLKAQTVYRMKLKDDKVLFVEPIWVGKRIRDIIQVNKNLIYILTEDGSLISWQVERTLYETDYTSTGYLAQPELGPCAVCHAFDNSVSEYAPNLHKIFNRVSGTSNYENYSDWFKDNKIIWNKENLTNFILNPSEFAPGTTMPKISLGKTNVKKIVDTLSGL
jgi:hypothetical protein